MKIGSLGRCGCGKLMYRTRAEAKKARRQLGRDSQSKRIYKCLEFGTTFHIGDLDPRVVSGELTRDDRYIRSDEFLESKETIRARSGGLCELCGGRGYEMSHRRSRRVRDDHQNCACNLIWSCRTCHKALHDGPTEAFANGWFVSQFEAEPGTVPVAIHNSWWLLRCDGKWDYLVPASVEIDNGAPVLVS